MRTTNFEVPLTIKLCWTFSIVLGILKLYDVSEDGSAFDT
jgi:hypothetical protein